MHMATHNDSHQSRPSFLYFPLFDNRTSRQSEDAETAELRTQLEELSKLPPPIGLELNMESSNLVELIEKRLNSNYAVVETNHHKFNKNQALVDKAEKSKAEHFPFSFLRIGAFEAAATYAADLVAKCYYGKRKFVWEILHNGLKNKIEIPWEEILAMRATIEENRPGILELELNEPPTFFDEIDPKPRQHTLWTPTSDFTGGQASIYRRHYLEFPPGILEKHYEKLKSEGHLLQLSQTPFPSLASPYFHPNIPSGYDEHEPLSCSQPIPPSEQLPIFPYEVVDRLQDLTLAFRNQETEGFPYLPLPASDFMSDDCGDAKLHTPASNYNNFNDITQFLYVNSTSGIGCEERHTENSGITQAININTSTQPVLVTPLNASELQELYTASISNANVKEEQSSFYSQLPRYLPPLQVFNENSDTRESIDTLNPCMAPQWSKRV